MAAGLKGEIQLKFFATTVLLIQLANESISLPVKIRMQNCLNKSEPDELSVQIKQNPVECNPFDCFLSGSSGKFKSKGLKMNCRDKFL